MSAASPYASAAGRELLRAPRGKFFRPSRVSSWACSCRSSLDRGLQVAAYHRARPRGQSDRLHLGRHRDPARDDDLHPVCGKLADLFDRKLLIQSPRDLRPRLGHRRILAGHQHDDHDPCGPGPRRRRPRRPQPGRHGRHHLPARARKVHGTLRSIVAVGTVGGPLIGGVITDTLGWRWNFFVALPFAVACPDHPAANPASAGSAQAEGQHRLLRDRPAVGGRLAAAHLGLLAATPSSG